MILNQEYSPDNDVRFRYDVILGRKINPNFLMYSNTTLIKT